jgi:hypothetical protein
LRKAPALHADLEGRFDAEHTLVVRRILAHIDYLDEAIDDLSAAIEQQQARCLAEGKAVMSPPVSAMITSAARRPTPRIVHSRSTASSKGPS